MAIVFHSEKYSDIKIDSHIIIGVSGYDYKGFLKSLTGDNIYYLKNEIKRSNRTIYEIIDNDLVKDKISNYLKDLGLDDSFLNKKMKELSHSERKLFGYLQMLIIDANIVVVDEPFLDLDYYNKKKIISLFNKMAKTKTIIIGSNSSDVIYSLCKKVLLFGKSKFLYDNTNVLTDKSILKRFSLTMPEIVEFVRIAKDKKINLSYNCDIRDLIKDVYRNVSK